MCESARQKWGHTKRHARPPGHIAAEIISNSNMLHTSEVNTVFFWLEFLLKEMEIVTLTGRLFQIKDNYSVLKSKFVDFEKKPPLLKVLSTLASSGSNQQQL